MTEQILVLLLDKVRWFVLLFGLVAVVVIFSFFQAMIPLMAKRLFNGRDVGKRETDQHIAKIADTLAGLAATQERLTNAFEKHNEIHDMAFESQREIALNIKDIHKRVVGA